jgi:O-antigen/teichoic acid export membrane protein
VSVTPLPALGGEEIAADPPVATDRDTAWLARSSASTLAVSVAVLALGFVQSVVTARVLGPGGKGEVFLMALTATTVALIAGCSLGPALQVSVGRGEASAPEVTRFVLLFVLVASAALGLAGSFVAAIAGRADLIGDPLVDLGFALVPAEMLYLTLAPQFLAVDRLARRNVVDLASAVIAVVLLLVFVGVAGSTATVVALALVVARWTSAGTYVALLSGASRGRPGRGDWRRRALHFGLRQHGATVMARGMKRADSYLLAGFLGTKAVGVYSVASTLAELPLTVARAINPAVTSFTSSKDRSAAASAVAAVNRLLLLASAVAFPVVALALAFAIEPVFGAGFGAAAAPLAVLLVSTACLGVYVVLGGYLVGAGRPGALTTVLVVPMVVNLAASAALIPAFELVGDAVATAIGGVLTLVLVVRSFSAVSGIGWRETIVPRRGDVGRAITALRSRDHSRGPRT